MELLDKIKKCNQCYLEKPIDNFFKHETNKDRLVNKCKPCFKNYQKLPKEILPDNYKKCTGCQILKTFNNFFKHKHGKFGLDPKCKSCIKNYRDNNKHNRRLWEKQYRLNNINKIKEVQKKSKKKNRLKINLQRQNRKKTDINFRLSLNLRSRLHGALKSNQKVGSAIDDLGCSVDDLKWWLEFWFEEGMSWENYGHGNDKWNIDHIVAISLFDLINREELLIACNYKNLQPMWQTLNFSYNNKRK